MNDNIGLKRNTIKLLPFSIEWKTIFKNEKRKILKGIKDYIISVEHIGSTSILNICSKPIIDICISLKNYSDGLKCVNYLESIGYIYKDEFGIPGRHYFSTKDETVKFHIHMFEEKNLEYKNHIYFRDYLNKYPEEAKKYEKLKFKLKEKYSYNRDLYTEGKSKFIKKILKKAIIEFG